MRFSKIKLIKKIVKRPGDALILTMFIMAGMLIVAMSGSYVALVGIKAAGVQSQSTKAYYAAEAGAEKFLWELYKNNYSHPKFIFSPITIFNGSLSNNTSYQVYYTQRFPLTFKAVGDYRNSKRSVEIIMGAIK